MRKKSKGQGSWMVCRRSRVARAAFMGGTLVLLAAVPAKGATRGSGGERECKAAYARAQEQEQAGSLREARDSLVGCSKLNCSQALRQQCEVEYNRLDSRIPTVVPRFLDKNGAARTDVQVLIDGQPLATPLDGQPVTVDPGVHEFTFKTADGQTFSKKIMIVESDRERPIDGGLVPPQAAPSEGAAPPAQAAETPPQANAGQPPANAAPKEPSPPPPPPVPEEPEEPLPVGPPGLPFALGGAGIVLAGTGAGFLIFGTQKSSALALDGIGVGVGAIVGAIWLLARPRPREKPAPHAAYTVDVHPAYGGGVASVSGAF